MDRASLRCAFTVVLVGATALACVDPLTTHATSSPAWTARNVKVYGETVLGLPPGMAYGWDLRLAGGVARWRECTSAEACGDVERQRPAEELLAVTRVGRTDTGDGGSADVLRLSLAPRSAYVVPRDPPTR